MTARFDMHFFLLKCKERKRNKTKHNIVINSLMILDGKRVLSKQNLISDDLDQSQGVQQFN